MRWRRSLDHTETADHRTHGPDRGRQDGPHQTPPLAHNAGQTGHAAGASFSPHAIHAKLSVAVLAAAAREPVIRGVRTDPSYAAQLSSKRPARQGGDHGEGKAESISPAAEGQGDGAEPGSTRSCNRDQTPFRSRHGNADSISFGTRHDEAHQGDPMSKPPPMYINRELSWLEFNQRVLDEALDQQIPPLERLKFLAITASNLDEFFMVRVGGLQMLAEQDPGKRDPAGMTPREQLAGISRRVHQMAADQYRCFLRRPGTDLGRQRHTAIWFPAS